MVKVIGVGVGHRAVLSAGWGLVMRCYRRSLDGGYPQGHGASDVEKTVSPCRTGAFPRLYRNGH